MEPCVFGASETTTYPTLVLSSVSSERANGRKNSKGYLGAGLGVILGLRRAFVRQTISLWLDGINSVTLWPVRRRGLLARTSCSLGAERFLLAVGRGVSIVK